MAFLLLVLLGACADDGSGGAEGTTGGETTSGTDGQTTTGPPGTDATGEPTTGSATSITTTTSDTSAPTETGEETSSSSSGSSPTGDSGDDSTGSGSGSDGSESDASSSTTSEAQACLVPATHATVQAAIADVGCDTVRLSPGTYGENLFIARDVAIERFGDGAVVLDGQGAGSTVTVGLGVAVVLRGLTVTGGAAPQGGGIRSGGTLLLDDVVVTGNSASGNTAQGGGIFAVGDTQLRATVVEANTVTATGSDALARGGGIWLEDASLELADGSRIAGNTVTVSIASGGSGAGGGVFARSSSVVLDAGTVVEDNAVAVSGTAAAVAGHTANGGGVAVSDCDLVLEGVELSGNSVTASGAGLHRVAEGGGLYASGGTVTADGVLLDGNVALADGGAATAAGGGAVVVDAVSVELVGVRAHENVATAAAALDGEEAIARGGALYVGAAAGVVATLDLRDTVVAGGVATAETADLGVARGGGVYLDAQTGASLVGRLERVAVITSAALAEGTGEGGGLAVYAGDNATVDLVVLNATFSGNTVDGALIARGGGLGVAAPLAGGVADVELRFVTAVRNLAGIADGAELGVWAGLQGSAHVGVGRSVLHDDGAGAPVDCRANAATILSGGGNVFGDGGCSVFAGEADLTGVAPVLDPLDEAADQPIHLPGLASQARDLVAVADCTDDAGVPLTNDQRDLPRPAGAGCDAGAAEAQP